MATTTNYGWTTPDDTALVKDGAAAIRSLGSSIDTSLNTALSTKKSGLLLLKTYTPSAVSSLSLDANTFTSTFRRYRIVASLQGSTDVALFVRLRTGTTDATTAYYQSMMYMVYTSTAFSGGAVNNGSAFNLSAVSSVANTRNYVAFDISDPQQTQNTLVTSLSFQADSYLNFAAGKLSNLTSYDSLTIYPSSGNITGSVSVFAYNE